MNQILLLKIGTWYVIVEMLILAILSIKAYRCSLKKIFILFMIISIPTLADKLYAQANLFSLKKLHNTIPNLITGKDIQESFKKRPKSAQFMQYKKAQGEIWAEALKKQDELKKEYAEVIAEQRKSTWLTDLWDNILWRLSNWLFPIGAIIVCLNEMKSSNQSMDQMRCRTPLD